MGRGIDRSRENAFCHGASSDPKEQDMALNWTFPGWKSTLLAMVRAPARA